MQTFLPYPDFKKSAECLDYRRLGKQRVETLQLLKALNGETKGWVNHPITKMWKGYEYSLIHYGEIICYEWIKRKYNDSCLQKIFSYYDVFERNDVDPYWLGDEKFHSSHRAALLYKDYVHYSQFGWTEEPKLDYVWF